MAAKKMDECNTHYYIDTQQEIQELTKNKNNNNNNNTNKKNK